MIIVSLNIPANITYTIKKRRKKNSAYLDEYKPNFSYHINMHLYSKKDEIDIFFFNMKEIYLLAHFTIYDNACVKCKEGHRMLHIYTKQK
jgi:hypothetical protein